MTPEAEAVKHAAETVRDHLTGNSKHALAYPMAFDIIACTPYLCQLLADALKGKL